MFLICSFTTTSSFEDKSIHDVDKESILKMGRLSIVNGDQSSVSYCQLLKNGTMNFYNSSNKANQSNFEGSINLKNAIDIGFDFFICVFVVFIVLTNCLCDIIVEMWLMYICGQCLQ